MTTPEESTIVGYLHSRVDKNIVTISREGINGLKPDEASSRENACLTVIL